MHRNSFFNLLEEGVVRVVFHQVTDYVTSTRDRAPTFVEVGANDGVNSSKTIEFIRYRDWTGLCVEPVPAVFKDLERNLSPHPNVKAVHRAIGDRSGVLPFYQVIGKGEKSGDVWLPMLSSFDRNVILRQSITVPDIEDHIEEIEVETSTLSDLADDYGLKDIDILVVDAEGFDDRIVRTLDFSRFSPLLIQIEHLHISPDRLRDLDRLLSGFGYQRCIMWMDTIWFGGPLLQDECIRRMIKSMPTLMPEYDTTYGNGYWIAHYDA